MLLRRGSVGEQVKTLQQFLNLKDDSFVNGVFGF
jgi:hypothetical protein